MVNSHAHASRSCGDLAMARVDERILYEAEGVTAAPCHRFQPQHTQGEAVPPGFEMRKCCGGLTFEKVTTYSVRCIISSVVWTAVCLRLCDPADKKMIPALRNLERASENKMDLNAYKGDAPRARAIVGYMDYTACNTRTELLVVHM